MLRLLEHYPSIQGEGPRTGAPTQFVRFAGCNLRCPSWPCDTQFAIEPKLYRKEQQQISAADLATQCAYVATHTGCRNVCLTGGEPMLQHTDDIDALITLLTDPIFGVVEMFSNGTLRYSDTVLEQCCVIMDWKLPGSGERADDPMRIQNYQDMMSIGGHTIKFTCANYRDLVMAQAIYNRYSMADFQGRIYVGPVWDAGLPPAQIAEFILDNKLPWNLNLQIHKYVWPPDARRT
jgi:7-carboxy-7-deazaguanine synthase